MSKEPGNSASLPAYIMIFEKAAQILSMKTEKLLGINSATWKSWKSGTRAVKLQEAVIKMTADYELPANNPKIAKLINATAVIVKDMDYPHPLRDLNDVSICIQHLHDAETPGSPPDTNSASLKKPVGQNHETPDQALVMRETPPGYGRSREAKILPKYGEFPIYEEVWKQKLPFSSLITVHLNGGVLRKERLEWQLAMTNKFLPDYFQWPDKMERKETEIERDRRLEIELSGAEPWPRELKSFKVYIGTKANFSRWSNENYEIEDHQTALLFWKRYLRKLEIIYHLLNVGLAHSEQFKAELYQIHHLDYLAHIFDSTKQGGWIIIATAPGGTEWHYSDRLDWPKSEKVAPAVFLNFMKRLDRAKTSEENLARDWTSFRGAGRSRRK